MAACAMTWATVTVAVPGCFHPGAMAWSSVVSAVAARFHPGAMARTSVVVAEVIRFHLVVIAVPPSDQIADIVSGILAYGGSRAPQEAAGLANHAVEEAVLPSAGEMALLLMRLDEAFSTLEVDGAGQDAGHD